MREAGPILFVIGLILTAIAAAKLATAAFGVAVGDDAAPAFLLGAFITAFAGGALAIAFRVPRLEISQQQAFILTVLTWVAACAFAAIPFTLIEEWSPERGTISYADAFFEAMSGRTTTGSTVFFHLDRAPPTVMLWRSVLQWMGGIGIIVMAIAILPFLQIGGMQLFKTESTDRSEKVMPRPGQIAKATAQIYLLLTVLCAITYFIAGMDAFDAVNHAFTTVATGGFSTHDASFGHYEEHAIHWTATIFMLLGGLPFVLFVKAIRGAPDELLRDPQVRMFLLITASGAAAVAAWLVLAGHAGIWQALRLAAFNTTSIITGSGFALGDFSIWGTFPVMMMFLLMFIGACSGSTAGGIKIFRIQLIIIATRTQFRRMVHPHAIVPRQYGGVRLDDDIIASVLVFIAIYLLTVIAIAMLLSLTGIDYVTALTGAVTAVSNVGPGLGEMIGPSGNFAALPESAIWVLSAGMLLGRLELMTVFILLSPAFWRN
ncbi:MAG: potassium transporter TrkH [Alphaproteobacteria bacterium]|nr:potassium transporter TrkH [Alphaproteobacteria bacterium]